MLALLSSTGLAIGKDEFDVMIILSSTLCRPAASRQRLLMSTSSLLSLSLRTAALSRAGPDPAAYS